MSSPIDAGFSELNEKIQNLVGPILVLGASGFVGANLMRTLAQHRDDVVGTTSELPAWRLHGLPDDAVRLVDVLVDSELDDLLEAVDPKTVFDCVGYGGYPFETDAQRIYETNFSFLTRLLPRLAGRRIGAYIHAGSSSEYGTNAAGPGEREFVAPNSDYAVSKIAAANLIYLFGTRRHLPCANLRLYSVYGPFEEPSRLIPQIVRQGAAGKLPDFVRPEIARDFLYVEDAVMAFVHAAHFLEESHWGESFNIGTGHEWTIAAVAELARELFQIEAQPAYTMPARDWDVSHWFANIERARSLLQWEPKVDFRQGLRRTFAWFKALDDKAMYELNSKRRTPMQARTEQPAAAAPVDNNGSTSACPSEKRLFNLNSLSNGTDQTLLDYGRRCLVKFDGPLIGVEMGVAWGGGVEALARLWKGRGTVYGFDTFEGHPSQLAADPTSHEARCMEPHYLAYGREGLEYDYQRRHLDRHGLSNAVLVKGLVSEVSCDGLPKIHYCLLDLDMAASMTPAYRGVRRRIVPGGYLCIHDYIGHAEVAGFLREIVLPDGIWDLDREYPGQDLMVLTRNTCLPSE
jgi:nucleoside-diphosphate-sugar epimerase